MLSESRRFSAGSFVFRSLADDRREKHPPHYLEHTVDWQQGYPPSPRSLYLLLSIIPSFLSDVDGKRKKEEADDGDVEMAPQRLRPHSGRSSPGSADDEDDDIADLVDAICRLS